MHGEACSFQLAGSNMQKLSLLYFMIQGPVVPCNVSHVILCCRFLLMMMHTRFGTAGQPSGSTGSVCGRVAGEHILHELHIMMFVLVQG